jgi:hypothetical protein
VLALATSSSLLSDTCNFQTETTDLSAQRPDIVEQLRAKVKREELRMVEPLQGSHAKQNRRFARTQVAQCKHPAGCIDYWVDAPERADSTYIVNGKPELFDQAKHGVSRL